MRNDVPLMLFAAGFGKRMGALTEHQPKPLVQVAGKALVDHALEVADAAAITRRVINLHYRGQQLADHLAGRDILLSWERDQILETGGGLKAALPLLGSGPLLILNTDAIWTGQNPLTQLMQAWDDTRMDALLLTLPADRARSATGRSDFVITPPMPGPIRWAKGDPGHLYLGAQMVHPRILDGFDEPVFSFHGPWTKAISAGRAFAIEHAGDWCDVGHPQGIALAEHLLDRAKVDV